MKIEILFPEFCNLFGDVSNMKYLRQCLPQAEFFETPFEEEPRFVTEDMDLVYLGPMTERTQERVIEKFLPLKARLRALIDRGAVFLFTGNAMEVLGRAIFTEDGREISGLGLLPLTARRDMMHRHNSTFLGSFDAKPLMGFKSQFTMAYLDEDGARNEGVEGLFPVEKGVGLNQRCPFEGVRKKNFFGTYLLGPLLILNPDFTRRLLRCMGVRDPALAFEEDVEAAYEVRLRDFREKI